MESIASIPSEATYVAFSGSWNLAVGLAFYMPKEQHRPNDLLNA